MAAAVLTALPRPDPAGERGPDVRRIAGTLARAFFDDPVFRWGYPDDERRAPALPGFFALYAEAFLRHDETYVVGRGDGVALWAPPGREPIEPEHADEFGRRLEEAAGADAGRLFEVAGLIDEHRPPGTFWYLQFLAVEPERQGRGHGSELMARVLERADRDGVPAYLEATSPHNRSLYERHGFRTTAELVAAGGPPLWPMWREAGA